MLPSPPQSDQKADKFGVVLFLNRDKKDNFIQHDVRQDDLDRMNDFFAAYDTGSLRKTFEANGIQSTRYIMRKDVESIWTRTSDEIKFTNGYSPVKFKITLSGKVTPEIIIKEIASLIADYYEANGTIPKQLFIGDLSVLDIQDKDDAKRIKMINLRFRYFEEIFNSLPPHPERAEIFTAIISEVNTLRRAKGLEPLVTLDQGETLFAKTSFGYKHQVFSMPDHYLRDLLSGNLLPRHVLQRTVDGFFQMGETAGVSEHKNEQTQEEKSAPIARKMLINCKAGHSRSATVLTCFFSFYFGLFGREASEKIHEYRPSTHSADYAKTRKDQKATLLFYALATATDALAPPSNSQNPISVSFKQRIDHDLKDEQGRTNLQQVLINEARCLLAIDYSSIKNPDNARPETWEETVRMSFINFCTVLFEYSDFTFDAITILLDDVLTHQDQYNYHQLTKLKIILDKIQDERSLRSQLRKIISQPQPQISATEKDSKSTVEADSKNKGRIYTKEKQEQFNKNDSQFQLLMLRFDQHCEKQKPLLVTLREYYKELSATWRSVHAFIWFLLLTSFALLFVAAIIFCPEVASLIGSLITLEWWQTIAIGALSLIGLTVCSECTHGLLTRNAPIIFAGSFAKSFGLVLCSFLLIAAIITLGIFCPPVGGALGIAAIFSASSSAAGTISASVIIGISSLSVGILSYKVHHMVISEPLWREKHSADKEPTETSPLLAHDQPTSSEEPSSTSSSSSYQTGVNAYGAIAEEISTRKSPVALLNPTLPASALPNSSPFDNGGPTLFALQKQEQPSSVLTITAASSSSLVMS